MRTPRDLTGLRFGSLVVRGRGERESNSWVCACDCESSRTKIVKRVHLVTGATTHCGCLTNRGSLTGKVFGRLTVVRKLLGGNSYECRCSCREAAIKIAIGYQLRSGAVSSCGCLRSEVISTRNHERAHFRNYDRVINLIAERCAGCSNYYDNGSLMWCCRMGRAA